MALQTTGEITVEVDRDTAFKFIEVPEQLAQCIPGCTDLRQAAPGSFTAVLTNEVSFITLSFQVVVEVVKIDSPHTIEAKITGKPVGFSGQLIGTAKLHLAEAGQSRTIIRHSSTKFGANLKAAIEKNVGGKEALGERQS
jgi:carbon monoxide dehydrogenase subunit G